MRYSLMQFFFCDCFFLLDVYLGYCILFFSVQELIRVFDVFFLSFLCVRSFFPPIFVVSFSILLHYIVRTPISVCLAFPLKPENGLSINRLFGFVKFVSFFSKGLESPTWFISSCSGTKRGRRVTR